MVLVMVLDLGFCGHWAQVGTVGDGGGVTIDRVGEGVVTTIQMRMPFVLVKRMENEHLG